MSMQLTIFEYIKTEKRCSGCKEAKPLSNFCKSKREKDKLHFYCRQCQKTCRENNKEKIAQLAKAYRENNKKEIAARSMVYYKNNKEKIAQYAKVYQQNNKEALAKYRKAYKNNNKPAQNAWHRSYNKKRRKSDPLLRVVTNLRNRISAFCKSVNMKKNWKTIDAMGCNREEFKEYFEPLFTEGMTWENYGAWHVDHIKPISLATTEQEAIQLSYYTNLQPLWAEDNLRKSNKY